MKFLNLVAIVSLTGNAAIASVDCTYGILRFKDNSQLMLHSNTENIINQEMQKKGYVEVSDPEAARFQVGSNVMIEPISYSIIGHSYVCSAEVVLTVLDYSHGHPPAIKAFMGKATPVIDLCPRKMLIKKAMKNAVEKVPSCF